MKGKIKVYIANTGQTVETDGGSTLSDLLPLLSASLPFKPICALVNNRVESMHFPVFMPKTVEFLPPSSKGARRVLTRSLCMLLYKAVSKVHPDARLVMEHSIGHGYVGRLFRIGTQERIQPDIVALLDEMRSLVEADIPFRRHEARTEEVRAILTRQHLDSAALLLDTLGELYTVYYTLDGLADIYQGPLAPSTGCLDIFNLAAGYDGMILLPPDPYEPSHAALPVRQPKMQEAFREHLDFNRIVGVSDVGELNRAVDENRSADLINVSEALHSKKLARISDMICECGARVVLIAGPSSSGKTTTSKRLGIQLMTNLKRPKLISLDDYFVDRDKTPRDSEGEYDYESLYALDLERLNADLNALLAGKEINLPTYSFELGRRVEKKRPLSLGADEVLVIEGIHGLNPELVGAVDSGSVFKVFVSALTTLAIDDHSWIPTSDNRLLRRIVRDHKYRNTSALETIRRWDSVGRGEQKWIFPFQENADATFNSSLLFELAVMKEYAEPLLRRVPHDIPEYSEASRLLRFLGVFLPIPEKQIPPTSLLREFLGGSSFHY